MSEMNKELLKIGKYCTEVLNYDSCGITEEGDAIYIGFQNNSSHSIKVEFKDDGKYYVSYNIKCTPQEVMMFYLQVCTKIPGDVVFTGDFKLN